MKKLLNLWAILAIVGTTALMTGCGGDDDDDDNGAGAGLDGSAPASFSGKKVVLSHDAGPAPQEVHFATSGNTFTAFAPGTADVLLTGTFQYTRTGPDSATLVFTEADGTVRTTNLNFTSTTGGNFSFTTNTGATGTGTFSGLTDVPGGQQPPPGGDQPPPGGDEPPPGGDEPPPGGDEPPPGGDEPPPTGDGNPPAALAGRTIVFNVATGPLVGQTSVTFAAGNTFSASNTGSGNYTYTLSGNSATLVLDYNAPPDFVGDRDTFVMTFTSGTSGTFTGTTRIDETESSHSGTFQVQ